MMPTTTNASELVLFEKIFPQRPPPPPPHHQSLNPPQNAQQQQQTETERSLGMSSLEMSL